MADLRKANLNGAYLIEANLWGANLSEANLHRADFREADLRKAKLTKADLREANLTEADLAGTDISYAWIASTTFGGNDLSNTLGLERTRHMGTSTIGTNTIQYSKGQLPIEFLRGCGLSDLEIEQAKLAAP